ncbi:magnesium transporter [Ignavigranum ruoffiae]|uniref:Magnesium transport protein CorA n=1 Tax=Ignavigranum ruoffiae TaxID=89093 RepID=A0A1H9BXA0_9LACT|nr:magnesium/cobalt transporter CorA [Ignavigranum ruoffiae]SEP93361.1 magnesium transporter [Ignavigranum ruoffiae]
MGTRIKLYEYNTDYLYRRTLDNLDKLEVDNSDHHYWLSIQTDDPEQISNQLLDYFDWHPLMIVEDEESNLRSKFQEFKNYLSLLLVLTRMDRNQDIINESIQFILYDNLLITIEPEGHGIFSWVISQLHAKSVINEHGTAMLMYYLIDAVMESYMEIFEHIDYYLDELEEEILDGDDQDSIEKINHINKYLLSLKKGLWPMRTAIGSLTRGKHAMIDEDTQKYFHDVYEDMSQLNEMVELYRGLCSNLYDSHLARVNNRMNEIMQTLTVIATIFTPLTFLAGVYGMNFVEFPEIRWEFGYAMFWIICIVVALVLIWYFKRKKWF